MKRNKILIIILVVSLFFHIVQWNSTKTYKEVIEHDMSIRMARIYSISKVQFDKIDEAIRMGYISEEDVSTMKFEFQLLFSSLLELRDIATISGVEVYSNFDQYDLRSKLSSLLLDKDIVIKDYKLILNEHSKENFKSISERLEHIINVMENYSYPSHKNYSDLMRIWRKIATELSKNPF